MTFIFLPSKLYLIFWWWFVALLSNSTNYYFLHYNKSSFIATQKCIGSCMRERKTFYCKRHTGTTSPIKLIFTDELKHFCNWIKMLAIKNLAGAGWLMTVASNVCASNVGNAVSSCMGTILIENLLRADSINFCLCGKLAFITAAELVWCSLLLVYFLIELYYFGWRGSEIKYE